MGWIVRQHHFWLKVTIHFLLTKLEHAWQKHEPNADDILNYHINSLDIIYPITLSAIYACTNDKD